MPRAKVVMKFIKDNKKRESTYKKRVGILVQKISQLTALCGVDILFVSVKPGTDGAGGQHGITTWPANRGAVKELVTLFYQTIPEKRKLVKVRQCRLDDVLTLWDCHLDNIPVDELVRQHHAMGDILERVQRRIAGDRLADEFVEASDATLFS